VVLLDLSGGQLVLYRVIGFTGNPVGKTASGVSALHNPIEIHNSMSQIWDMGFVGCKPILGAYRYQ
jgi:hypothetical protein